MTMRINDALKSEFPAMTRERPSSRDATFEALISTANAQAPAPDPVSASGQDAQASQQVTFDQSALGFAGLAARGVTAMTLDHNPLAAEIAGLPDSTPAGPLVRLDGSVSKAEFESLVAQFGGSKVQADGLFATFDANGDGSISHSEFLAGLANVDVDGGATPFAQTLGQLMDDHGNRNGHVDNMEFGDFEAAFVHAEELNQTSRS